MNIPSAATSLPLFDFIPFQKNIRTKKIKILYLPTPSQFPDLYIPEPNLKIPILKGYLSFGVFSKLRIILKMGRCHFLLPFRGSKVLGRSEGSVQVELYFTIHLFDTGLVPLSRFGVGLIFLWRKPIKTP